MLERVRPVPTSVAPLRSLQSSKSGKSPPDASRTRSPEQKRIAAKVGLSVLTSRTGSPAPVADRAPSAAPSWEQFLEIIRKDDTAVISDTLVHHPSLVSLRNANNYTALHVAANEGKAGAVKALLSAAWKDQILNANNDEGWTPLMLAASSGHAACCRLLLEAGAYVRCETRSHTTVLHLVARWLPDKGVDTSTVNGILDLLLTCGALIDAANQHGVTPLHEAAQMGNHEVVRFLLKRGATAAPMDKFGQTPHALAARKGFTEVCKAFTDHEEKLAEAKEKELKRSSIAMLSDEEKRRLDLDMHSSVRLHPLTGDRRASSRSMALTLALYSSADRASGRSVPPVAIPPQPPKSSAGAEQQATAEEKKDDAPTSPKGLLIYHSPEEANNSSNSNQPSAAVVSPRRSVNMALMPLVNVEAQQQQQQQQQKARGQSLYVKSPPRATPPATLPVVSVPTTSASSASSPPQRTGATSPPSDAQSASMSIPAGQESNVGQWMAFLAECGLPQASRLAIWLVNEGVELEESRDLPDDFMKALTFSTAVSPPDLVVLYKRYWTLRGSSLK